MHTGDQSSSETESFSNCLARIEHLEREFSDTTKKLASALHEAQELIAISQELKSSSAKLRESFKDKLKRRTHETFAINLVKNHLNEYVVLGYVLDLLDHAKKFKGYAYGAVVRDLIVPALFHGLALNEMEFSAVDIWFKTQEQADALVEHYLIAPAFLEVVEKAACKKLDPHRLIAGGAIGGQYMLISPDHQARIVTVNLIVSKEFPSNDFSVNSLVYYPSECYPKLVCSVFSFCCREQTKATPQSIIALLDQVYYKIAYVLPAHLELLMDKEGDKKGDKTQAEAQIAQLKHRGWKLSASIPEHEALVNPAGLAQQRQTQTPIVKVSKQSNEKKFCDLCRDSGVDPATMGIFLTTALADPCCATFYGRYACKLYLACRGQKELSFEVEPDDICLLFPNQGVKEFFLSQYGATGGHFTILRKIGDNSEEEYSLLLASRLHLKFKLYLTVGKTIPLNELDCYNFVLEPSPIKLCYKGKGNLIEAMSELLKREAVDDLPR
jgi:hypothetical protein